MKKIIISALLLAGMACAFAESHLNFTVPLKFGCLLQADTIEYTDAWGDTDEEDVGIVSAVFTLGATAEYLYTFGEGAFGLGAKVGGELGSTVFSTSGGGSGGDFNGTAAGWNVAPALGFVFKDKTITQITIYPIGYAYYSLGNLKEMHDDYDIPDGTIDTLKTGVAFSWQWGSNVHHGFEVGLDIMYNTTIKIDGEKLIDKAGGGFSLHTAYKVSLDF